jgi:hypothetical protein
MNNREAVRLGTRSLWNRAKGWPICVSFEVTHSCIADCVHCDKGGLKREPRRLTPRDYGRFSRELKPGVIQLSGGEPLLRDDLEDIVREVKRPGGLPMTACVTNSWLLTEERYLSLHRAGVSLFSISLDFPDDRHDDFRRIPGLFAKMNELIPYLVHEYGRKDIVLNAALTHANFPDIPGLVAKAEEWGTQISFSAYSCLRTGDTSLCINEPGDLALLRSHIDYLEKYEPRTTVLNSDHILEQTYRFFAEGGICGTAPVEKRSKGSARRATVATSVMSRSGQAQSGRWGYSSRRISRRASSCPVSPRPPTRRTVTPASGGRDGPPDTSVSGAPA